MRAFVAFITLIVFAAPSAWAAGFYIFEPGARALGMAGAIVARADDPSALFFNPAGIARLEGTQVYLGASFIFTGTDFAGADPSPGVGMNGTTGSQLFTPVNAYVTHTFREDVAVGIGVFNNFGLGVEWEGPDTWPGRPIAHNTQVRTWNVNPSVAWSPNELFSIGAGLQILYIDVEIERYIVSGGTNIATVLLDANDVGFGFNAGAQAKPHDDFVVGASFRSGILVEPDGDATFTQIVPAPIPPNQGVKANADLPWLLSFAGAWEGVDRWAFEADINIFGWSTFDALTFAFDDPSLDETRVQDYETVVNVRTGASFALTEEIELRGGYYFDPTPQPKKAMSPLLGDADRHGITLGAGYDAGPWWVDAFLLVLFTEKRSTGGESLDGFDGEYDTFGNLFGINLGTRF
jgi:long-chain fatty acid transport protein